MLRNLIITAGRNLVRHKAYALLNVVGLTIGISGCLLVLLFVRLEFSRGTAYPKTERIYRVISWTLNNDNERRYNRGSDGLVAPAMLESFPEVEGFVRSQAHWPVRVRWGDTVTGDHQIAIVDTSFLETFDVELISGDRRTALSAPNGVILAERAAKVIFGDRDPLGQTLTVDHRQVRGEYTVTGIAKDPRWTVYALNFNLITAHRPPAVAWDRVLMSGPWRPIQTFVLLREGANVERLSSMLGALNVQVNGEEWGGKAGYALQPLKRIHLYGRQDYPGIAAFGNIQTVYVLSGIALFVPLASFTAEQRTKEIAIRKVAGATSGNLFALLTRGFLQPVLLACLIGWPIAYVLMDRWLADYAHRIDLDAVPFLMGGVGVMIAALVTVGYRTLKAAGANPVEALRSE